MTFQEARHFQGVFRVLALAQRQRLQPLDEEERVERADRRPDVAQQLHAHLDDERHIAQPGEFAEDKADRRTAADASLERLRDHKILCGPGLSPPICSAKSPFFAQDISC